MSYVLAALEEKNARVGGELGTDAFKWAAIEKGLPEITRDDGGSSLAVDFSLEPGQEKVVRLILAWYAPEWEGNGNPGTGGRPIPRPPCSRGESPPRSRRFSYYDRKAFHPYVCCPVRQCRGGG